MTMVELAILIPVLRRPQNITPLVASIRNTTADYELLFIASPSDHTEMAELEVQGQQYIVLNGDYEDRGDYAKKINRGFESIKANWYFLGADDLRFHPGWFEAAMRVQAQTDACVIGTNDLGNPRVIRGDHSTHSLVLRDYVAECGTIDEPGKVLHEGYPHEFVDDEFIVTAKWRGAWAFAGDSRVEHLHPNWQKAVMDPIYARQEARMDLGKTLFEQRKRLWAS